MTTIAVAGDTMLGRLCVDTVASGRADAAFAEQVRAAAGAADLFVANLECCISDGGVRWAAPGKPFFFRAPPAAARLLADLGVDVVTLANNHALDYGHEALLDTLALLDDAGIAVVGAGPDLAAARRPVVVDVGGLTVAILGVSDHPADFAAGAHAPGIAYADLRTGVPDWLTAQVRELAGSADVVLVTPHWGPNMTPLPVPHVVAAAERLVDAGATVIAGHSAHVFHGVAWRRGTCVLYDTGDFYDDYAVDPQLRNDLGVLWTVELDGTRPVAVTALPLGLHTCRTDVADSEGAGWVTERLTDACAAFGTVVELLPDQWVLRCRPAPG